MGKPRIKRILLDLPNRMVEHTIATRHLFAGVIRAHQAQIVFTPWPEDAHPDHRAVSRSVEDARFDAKLTKIDMPVPRRGFEAIGPPIYPKWLFYYHVSHLRATITPSFVLDITGQEQKKLAAVRAYRSQFGPWDDPPTPGPVETGFAKGDPKAGRLVTPDLPERLLGYAAYMGSLIGTSYGEPFTDEGAGGAGVARLARVGKLTAETLRSRKGAGIETQRSRSATENGVVRGSNPKWILSAPQRLRGESSSHFTQRYTNAGGRLPQTPRLVSTLVNKRLSSWRRCQALRLTSPMW